ncbi:XrtB/PEP-CTERM-associated transcriptional regulator EpsA [Actimicrobium sp. CCI2.3]|uniref:XrtB/PEP-CTERM-associated transcriptional regulator EpsA n=1 Tax=Actimicrobium sp. CCI2.3 TaxID=3048616 RepID=UPI002AB5D6E9|nr:XrtB/PEP-CTERM-associated transcriptional regulator EpsA [Actimicrobium sp. CCI2.3]MDY7574736.1 LuxR C-terminal-related transcriptional regulator [Actimicrobium sp. CCI2.3]MEB0020303.1 LuxR C-terminal-related transcriptional regulator [Actimicrobium sp. CCI2.3]
MKFIAILSKIEEEYLIRVSEAAVYVRNLRQFYLWAQGQLQGLLPHQAMVCIHLGDQDEVVYVECFDGTVRENGFMAKVCDAETGLAIRLARHCRSASDSPCVIGADTHAPGHPLAALQAELDHNGLGNALVHGTERLRGGSAYFVLFTMPQVPSALHVFFFELLLPHLYLAFQRVMASGAGQVVTQGSDHTLTARELEILSWVIKGKSNAEIGDIVYLSHLTVKNHLQNIYRKLGVHNRVQAIARCYSLQLLSPKT